MTVDGVKTIFDWIAVILIFLTFAAGVGVLITGNIINKRQSEQIRQFDRDLTGAKLDLTIEQGKTVSAEADLTKLKTSLAGAQKEADTARLALERQLVKQDRRANLFRDKKLHAAFVSEIEAFAKQKVDIRMCPGNESEMWSLQLMLMGAFFGAKWEVMDMQTPLLGCGDGMFVMIAPEAPDSTRNAAGALMKALAAIGLLPSNSNFGLTDGRHSDGKTQYLETSSVDAILVGIQAHQ